MNQKQNKTVDNNSEHHFEILRDFPDYEISIEYPYPIRRKSNKYVISESDNGNGYIKITLNNKSYYKHKIVALQFIENNDPEHKTDVDHINHIRTDYHIENLRWISKSENNRNRSSYNKIDCEYVDDISDDAIKITDYGEHEFENYYYYNDQFYYDNNINYRILHVNETKTSAKFVNMRDINNKQVKIFINKFKKMYDLLDD